MQSRPAYCPAWGEFWDLWRTSWTDWAQHTYQWQQTATSHKLYLCARLLIPLSLVDAIPTTKRHKLRTEVGLFQFRMIQAVQTLRRKLADPTPHQPPSPLWLTKFVGHALPPSQTPLNLRHHVKAPMRSGTKSKRRTEVATAEPMDPDQWIRDARAANDDDAVAWLTRMRATVAAQGEQTQKRRGLSVAIQWWRQYKTTADRLAQEHAQQSHDIYYNAHAGEVTRHQLCTLHAYYTSTLTAKPDYHMLATKLIKEQMAAQRLHDTHTHMCQVRRQWCEQAKYDTMTWYVDAKTSLLICRQHEKMCAETNKLLDHHLRQARYMWYQQEHMANMTQWFKDECKHKTTQYWHTTQQARRTIYLIRKRPREHWDPTLLEVPLQPLPKRHKTHWEPNEWEIPLTGPQQKNHRGAVVSCSPYAHPGFADIRTLH